MRIEYVLSIISIFIELINFLYGKKIIIEIIKKVNKKKKSSIEVENLLTQKRWVIINIIIALILLFFIIQFLLPRWYFLDSGNYHLGDNIFRLDYQQRPKYQKPEGENIDNLIFWNKDTGQYSCSSSNVNVYPNSKLWKNLELERYSEYLGGNYYLGNVVIGYIKTFDLRDLKRNCKRIIKPKYLFLSFNVFDLGNYNENGGLIFILNNGIIDTYVELDDYPRYQWKRIKEIEIPLQYLNTTINTFYLYSYPKYTYHDEGKYFHFEDVEISDIKYTLK